MEYVFPSTLCILPCSSDSISTTMSPTLGSSFTRAGVVCLSCPLTGVEVFFTGSSFGINPLRSFKLCNVFPIDENFQLTRHKDIIFRNHNKTPIYHTITTQHTFRQHFLPFPSPESAAQHSSATFSHLSVTQEYHTMCPENYSNILLQNYFHQRRKIVTFAPYLPDG